MDDTERRAGLYVTTRGTRIGWLVSEARSFVAIASERGMPSSSYVISIVRLNFANSFLFVRRILRPRIWRVGDSPSVTRFFPSFPPS